MVSALITSNRIDIIFDPISIEVTEPSSW